MPDSEGLEQKEVPAPKRAKVKGDLTVVLDDGEVEVHSVILVLASPVFEKMLSSDMQEGSGSQIRLPGKLKAEFTEFYNALQLCTMNRLTPENAISLTCWAEEYQVSPLKTKCEDFLVSSVPVNASSLEHAIMYNLQRRTAQCLATMMGDLPKYVDQLVVLASANGLEHMRGLWPSICQRAGIPKFEMPPMDALRMMWPFLAAAVHHRVPATAWEDFKKKAPGITSELFSVLPRTGKADEIGKNFLVEQFKRHRIMTL
eukprot:gnl/MRDRNA2_/MRDRNA2_146923_c0_seq1.p1 gnl/MRDRNA2_/MRDRNA2_146923_c0~~gnl/MRDRNA2_/MRDRNA2_146923_c0_seq1.p1  ORF type:complete len:258 (-),score=55.93 gnl/MRDRNA2_/MRDRNA2_146923_c0_seq1:183-956(-)